MQTLEYINMKKFKKEIDIITSFLFVALVFFLLYIALWTFCPCGEYTEVTHNEHAEMTNN